MTANAFIKAYTYKQLSQETKIKRLKHFTLIFLLQRNPFLLLLFLKGLCYLKTWSCFTQFTLQLVTREYIFKLSFKSIFIFKKFKTSMLSWILNKKSWLDHWENSFDLNILWNQVKFIKEKIYFQLSGCINKTDSHCLD